MAKEVSKFPDQAHFKLNAHVFHKLLGCGTKDYVVHIDLNDHYLSLTSLDEKSTICSPSSVSLF